MKDKVILAYSGGLDTSIILTWLKETCNYDVIAVCADLGQTEDFNALKTKALKTGASNAYVVDAKQTFIEDYVFKGLKAGAVYEDDYLLGTAFARPLIAKILVDIAIKENAQAIAHGATGKGNDQVRFEAGIKALLPDIKIIAPWRVWSLKSRDALLNYAKKHHIPLTMTLKDSYSRDENLWHISHEGCDLEDPKNAHCDSIYKFATPLDKAPDQSEDIFITFENGIPIALNNTKLPAVTLIETLNEVGAKHGVGVIDIVENRLVGMKSRGVYETPGGSILYKAHKALEKLVLDKTTMHYKQKIALEYADLVYNGLWFSTLKSALDSFVDTTQQVVSGTIKLKLFKGNICVMSTSSVYSLYREDYVTFGEDQVYNQADATGFINLYTLPLKITGQIKQQQEMCHENNKADKIYHIG